MIDKISILDIIYIGQETEVTEWVIKLIHQI